MLNQGTIALAVAGLLALGAGSAQAVSLSVPSGTDALSAPKVSRTELKRAFFEAVENGARPRKLRAPTPAWFTDALQVRLAQRGYAPPPADAPLPSTVGIRPGAWMVAPHWCTMNFLFQKGGTLAIGTAGHCLSDFKDSVTADALGTDVTLLTLAPGNGNPVLVKLGRVLLKRNGGIGKDYGLVEIPPSLHQWAFPTVAGVGGPCGVYSDNTPLPVAHYGHGVGVGTGGTPRAGIGLSFQPPKGTIRGLESTWDNDSIFWAGLINGGDSGSPVRVGTLPAVSNLTHGIGLPITSVIPSAVAWGTRVTTITSSGWKLVNSPLCPPSG